MRDLPRCSSGMSAHYFWATKVRLWNEKSHIRLVALIQQVIQLDKLYELSV